MRQRVPHPATARELLRALKIPRDDTAGYGPDYMDAVQVGLKNLKEGGIEAVWTPVMNFNIAHCQLKCNLCSEVCPTGAIRKISVAEKLGEGEYAEQGPVRLGTADRIARMSSRVFSLARTTRSIPSRRITAAPDASCTVIWVDPWISNPG